ncbi:MULTISPECIES: hypothetical protein [unclassified Imperialibacter]|uniref:hypothetical protein n=1 Tax=unclassified Imperialibacter TaxID=2629706 RepID=UPI0012517440|nr:MULTISPECIES: hypothetical protein [unclassified Imperialibacter]CAD5290966.1 conserved exported hypothetical protein [Imperialibacter sp. 89]CAD5291200.1 conserved exported hypothetical protein [Imperialibacter sp. 75]VVT34409.1 conserved exported hypothetical protein [Imperialibacter sp. EC-SDR9]
MKRLNTGLSIFCLILLASSVAKSQDNGNYEYSREYIWGINKNTNSGLIGGIVLKYSQAMDEKTFRTFGMELINVKHPKEYRYISQYGNPFVWAKKNYLYAVRLQYGKDYLMFRKAPQQGVQINASWAAGPTLGIVAPYYVKYATGPSTFTVEQFDPARHSFGGILGTGRLFQGLGQSKIQPGLNAKAAINFEFGTFKSNVTGFEIGVLAEAFTKEIIIIPAATNTAFFTSAFFTLYYGARR